MGSTPIRLSPAQTLVITASTPERLEIEATWATGGGQPPMHWHPRQHEHFEVLSGELTVGLGDAAPRPLQAGETLEVPPRTAHRFWNAGEQVCTARWIVTPALRTAEMFRTIERSRSRLGTAARLFVSHRSEFRFGSPRG